MIYKYSPKEEFMFSSSPDLNQEISPEELYQIGLRQKADLSQRLESLRSASQSPTDISQEQRLAMESEYNMLLCVLSVIEKNIQDLTNHHPSLLSPRLPLGSITGDHYTGPTPYSSSGNSFTFSRSSQLTFHPGVKTTASANPDKRSNVKCLRK